MDKNYTNKNKASRRQENFTKELEIKEKRKSTASFYIYACPIY